MHKNVSKFKISMHDFIFDKSLEGIKNLKKEFDGFFFIESFFLFKVCREITLITILKNEVEIVGSFFNIIEFDNVTIITSFEYFDLIFEKLHEFAWVKEMRYL